jgi:NADH-quinone oxidoreductase subunit F
MEIVRRENPLPSVCGRVCTAPCEESCRAAEGAEGSVSIRALKRFLADYERANGVAVALKPRDSRPERAAIVGSGPAGLTCAHYLALEGYQVTIFESLPIAGGMLAVGIPDYRLPKDILNHEIQNIRNLGVEIMTGTAVGKDVQLADLTTQYNAVFIATGAHQGLELGIEGEDSPQVIDAVDFLRTFHLGREVDLGERVAVIGGGDAAVDAARVAKRLGKDVTVLYRRTRNEMPAAKEEVDELIREGIEIQFLVAPVRALKENGRLTGLECIRMKLGETDSSGRRRPVPIAGSEFTIEIDTLVPAISQRPETAFLGTHADLHVVSGGTLQVDPETMYTGVAGIFAGGDVVRGPDVVVQAMAQGKIAARMMHNYMQGLPMKREYRVTRPAVDVEVTALTQEEIERLKKQEMPVMPVEERIENFKEVQLGFTPEMAIAEAKRCLRCDRAT